jgi:hypothetical protein
MPPTVAKTEADLEPKDYKYCVTKGCKFRVSNLSVLLPKCELCGSDEYVDWTRKQAVEKGVASAQAAYKPEQKPAGEQKPPLPEGAKAT